MTTVPLAERTEPAPQATPPTPRWRYPNASPRDQRLDLLRGYALAAMAINHFGMHQSYLHAASGRSEFLVSAAEAFLLISGFTLGYISFGRTPERVTTRIATRTWTVYLATIGISLGLGAVALATDLQLWGELDAEGGAWSWISSVLTMQTAFNGADILIAYVLYLLGAIAAVRLMTAGRSGVVIAATVGAYVLSQLGDGAAGTLGFASFRALLPNAPLFFGGLLLGFHRERINGWWNRLPFHRLFDAGVIGAAVGLAWLRAEGWPIFASLGTELDRGLGVREYEMPILPLAIVLLYLRAAWLVVDACWVPIRRTLGWFLLPLGEASLYTFTMHLLAIPLIVNLPWWPGEQVGALTATGWVIAYLAIISGAVLLRQRLLRWLRAGGDGRAAVRRHGPVASIGVLLVALLVAWSSSGAAAVGADEELGDDVEIEEIADVVGTAVDGLVEGDLTAADVLALLPSDIDAGERQRIDDLLAEDPFDAEDAIVEAIVSAD